MKLSDIYAWQIDFFDIKEGDSFRLIYDEAWIDDTTFVDIVDIAGAVFSHQGEEYMAVPFTGFNKRVFRCGWKQPEKGISESTTRFFPHQLQIFKRTFSPGAETLPSDTGVDYAAPTGTPVRPSATG